MLEASFRTERVRLCLHVFLQFVVGSLPGLPGDTATKIRLVHGTGVSGEPEGYGREESTSTSLIERRVACLGAETDRVIHHKRGSFSSSSGLPFKIKTLAAGKCPDMVHVDSKAAMADYISEIGVPATFFMLGLLISGFWKNGCTNHHRTTT